MHRFARLPILVIALILVGLFAFLKFAEDSAIELDLRAQMRAEKEVGNRLTARESYAFGSNEKPRPRQVESPEGIVDNHCFGHARVIVCDAATLQPVNGATISIESDVQARETYERVSPLGVEVRDLKVGRYWVRVQLVPAEYLPPFSQELNLQVTDTGTREGARGFGRTEFEVTAGQLEEVSVYVHRHATVEGTLNFAARLGGADVQLICETKGLQNLDQQIRADEHGFFFFRHVYPQNYRLRIRLLDRTGQRSSQIASPVPISFDVSPGERKIISSFDLKTGSARMSGDVRDQLGQPFAGLECWLMPIESQPIPDWKRPLNLNDSVQVTSTDRNGVFSFDGIGVGQFKLICEPHSFRDGAPKNKVAFFPKPLKIQVNDAYTQQKLAPLIIHRSMPFEVTVNLANHRLPSGCKIRVEPIDSSLVGTSEFRGRKTLGVSEFQFSKNGTAQWRCETPHAGMKIALIGRSTGEVIDVQEIFPQPNGKMELRMGDK